MLVETEKPFLLGSYLMDANVGVARLSKALELFDMRRRIRAADDLLRNFLFVKHGGELFKISRQCQLGLGLTFNGGGAPVLVFHPAGFFFLFGPAYLQFFFPWFLASPP